MREREKAAAAVRAPGDSDGKPHATLAWYLHVFTFLGVHCSLNVIHTTGCSSGTTGALAFAPASAGDRGAALSPCAALVAQ